MPASAESRLMQTHADTAVFIGSLRATSRTIRCLSNHRSNRSNQIGRSTMWYTLVLNAAEVAVRRTELEINPATLLVSNNT